MLQCLPHCILAKHFTMQATQNQLSKYFPLEAIDELMGLPSFGNLRLVIHRTRRSKLGDFRPGVNGAPTRITVNGNLNVYAFLIVFLHEYAHWEVFSKFGKRAAPHGVEWKQTFGHWLRKFTLAGCFHPTLTDAIMDYSKRVKASGIGSSTLQRLLQMFDPIIKNDDGQKYLEDIPMNALFVAANGKLYRKEALLRKRFRCQCIVSKRHYLFHPLATVALSNTNPTD